MVSAVDGRAGWQLMVADYRDFYKGMVDPIEEPHTSHHSTDGGATWTEERGEYVCSSLNTSDRRLIAKPPIPTPAAAGYR